MNSATQKVLSDAENILSAMRNDLRRIKCESGYNTEITIDTDNYINQGKLIFDLVECLKHQIKVSEGYLEKYGEQIISKIENKKC